MKRGIRGLVALFLITAPLAFGQAAQKGINVNARTQGKFRLEYLHYRPAVWEADQVVEIERDFPNKGGLLYLYLRNISEETSKLDFWRYQKKDRSYWIQSGMVAWDRTWESNIAPGGLAVMEINGISADFAPGTSFDFAVMGDGMGPAVRHAGVLEPDAVNVALIRVLPAMDALEVHIRHSGTGDVRFLSVSVEGAETAEAAWRGQQLSGPGHAIARVKLGGPVSPATLLVLRVDLEEGGKTRSVYAHRRAFPDAFAVGTWGMDSENYAYLAQSYIDTGVKGGEREDAFFGGDAARYGLNALVHVGHWPENVRQLQSLSGHPAVRAWMLSDEPDWSSHVQTIFQLDRIVKSFDSTKPTTVTLCRNVKFMEFAPIVDLPCMDHYCVTAPTASKWPRIYGGRLEETGYYTRDLKHAAEPKPIMVWSQGIREWSQRPKRGTPTPEELSVQLVQNLGRGAKGILWFTWNREVAEKYPDLYDRARNWNRVMQVMKEDFLGSEPSDIVAGAPDKVDAAALVGWDRIILCLCNTDYEIDSETYPFVDKEPVKVALRLPEWLQPASALGMHGDMIQEAALAVNGGTAEVTLDKLHDAAVLVLPNFENAQAEYQQRLKELDQRTSAP